MQPYEQVLVPCVRTDPGMFSTERLVAVRDSGGETLQMFADCCVLVERDQRQYIRVTRMGSADEPGVSVCLLPVEGTETPSTTRWLRVRDAELLMP